MEVVLVTCLNRPNLKLDCTTVKQVRFFERAPSKSDFLCFLNVYLQDIEDLGLAYVQLLPLRADMINWFKKGN